MSAVVQPGEWISPDGILLLERVPTLFSKVQVVSMADGDSGTFVGAGSLPQRGKWRGLWYDTLEKAQGWMATNVCQWFGQQLVMSGAPVYGLTTESDEYGRCLMDLVAEWQGVLNGVAEAMIASGSAVLYHGLRPDNDPLRYKARDGDKPFKPKLLPGRNTPRGRRLAVLEELAIENKMGIWANDFVLPDVYRKASRGEVVQAITWKQQLMLA